MSSNWTYSVIESRVDASKIFWYFFAQKKHVILLICGLTTLSWAMMLLDKIYL